MRYGNGTVVNYKVIRYLLTVNLRAVKIDEKASKYSKVLLENPFLHF